MGKPMKPQTLFTLGLLTLSTGTIVYADAPVEDYSTEATTTNATPITTTTTTQTQTSAAPSATQTWQELKKENNKQHTYSTTNSNTTPASTMLSSTSNTSNMTMEQRVKRLEQQIDYLNKNNPQTQIEDLQQKTQKLSGDLETQQNKVTQLEKQINDFYTDLDQRLKSKNTTTVNNVTTIEPVTNGNNKNKATKAGKKNTKNNSQKANSTTDAENDKSTTYSANTVNPSDAPAAINNANLTKKELSLKEQQAYQAALDDLRNKQFTSGAQKLRSYLATYPNGTYAANAHYWLGEIYFLNNSYAKASGEFGTMVSKYPASPKLPEALFKLAYIHDKEGKHEQAQKEYRALKKRYPNSSAAKLADQQLQQTSTSTATTGSTGTAQQ